MYHEDVPLSRPDITDADIDAVVSVLRTDRLSIGPRIEAFEAAVARRANRKYGVGVNSGTSGLHLCVRALGIGEGDEVITTPFSFIATTNAILFEGATPVFVDIDPESYNMDPAAIESAITPRTKAILPVEVFGNTAHFDEYERIATKHDLLLIEDCCEALGGCLGDRPAGSFGDCGVFGFYPNKQITTGEGGMIVTDSERIWELCRAMRNQGRRDQSQVGHPILGYNYRMGEMTAALGQAQMVRLAEILEKRRHAARVYDEQLGDIEGIHLPTMADPDKAAWFVYVIRLADSYSRQQRDDIIESLNAEGIGCRAYFTPIHLQPYIRRQFGTKERDFPNTEAVASRTIAVPFYTNVSMEGVSLVKEALERNLANTRGRAATVEPPPSSARKRSLELLEGMHATMLRIRLFEERVSDMLEADQIQCPCHLYIGQEAIAAGVCAALGPDDLIWGTHRSHGHYLARGADMPAMMAEILGKKAGCAEGRGGSMHVFSKEAGILGTVPIVAATIPIAVGAGLASKIRKDGRVSVSFFGDGATEEGHFHESMNLAALYKLPVLFVCENNLYSSHMHIHERRPKDNLYEVGHLYDIPGIRVDGNNALEVYDFAVNAVRRGRNGEGPSLLECRTYRWRGHVGPSWDMDVGVKRRDELKQWLPRCPIARLRRLLVQRGVSEEKLDEVERAIRREVDEAVEFANRAAFPDESELLDHLHSSSEATS